MMNSTGKAILPKARTVDTSNDEESSWTSYFEDFLCNNNEHGSLSSGYESQSLVSDAASSVAKKFVDNDDKVEGFCLDIKRRSRNLSLKKRKKTKGALQVDDALEDTASSPVNSPKEKGNTSGQTEERSEMGIDGRDSDCAELKKRGLCLVPLSMSSNYLGSFSNNSGITSNRSPTSP